MPRKNVISKKCKMRERALVQKFNFFQIPHRDTGSQFACLCGNQFAIVYEKGMTYLDGEFIFALVQRTYSSSFFWYNFFSGYFSVSGFWFVLVYLCPIPQKLADWIYLLLLYHKLILKKSRFCDFALVQCKNYRMVKWSMFAY